MSVLIDCKARIKPKIESKLRVAASVSMLLVYLASCMEWSETIRFVLGLPAFFYIVLLIGTKADIWEQVEFEHGSSPSRSDSRNTL